MNQMITDEILRKLKEGKSHVIMSPIALNVLAQIRLTPQKTPEKTKIQVVLYSQNPKGRIPTVKEETETSYSYSALQVDIENKCRAQLTAYKETLPKKRTAAKKCEDRFFKRVLNVPGIMDPDNFRKYVRNGWGETTAKAAVNYYAHTMGQAYEEFGEDADTADLVTFREREINQIYQRQYHTPCSDKRLIEVRRMDIAKGVNTRFAQARVVQQFLLERYPEMGWPETPIPLMPNTIRKTMENIKTISYQMYVMLMVLLVRCCIARVPHAFAGAGTVLCALRMGESCAPLMGDFECLGGYGRYYVGHQINDKNQRTDRLKTDSSYRDIAFGPLFCSLVELRKKQLEEDGYDEKVYQTMPFGAKPSAPHDFLRKSEVSTFVRQLLALVGCDEAWLEQEATKMYAAADIVGNREDLDIGAHELRSTIATFAGNGGMPADMLDQYLGHTFSNGKKPPRLTWDEIKEVASVLERAIPYGSLCASLNPAVTPVEVSESVNYMLTGNTRYQFQIQIDVSMEVDITALECGQEIQIQLPETCEAEYLVRRVVPDTLESKRNRPVMPNLPDAETVEAWIRDAEKIDLSSILKRYGSISS